MSGDDPGRVDAGSGELPPILATIADLLPGFAGEDLEDQLRTFDTFLDVLSPSVRSRIADLLHAAAGRCQDDAVSARVRLAADSVARGGRAAAPHDHAVAMAAYTAAHRAAFPDPTAEPSGQTTFLDLIERAMARIGPMAEAGWGPAQSIARQLRWCSDKAMDKPVEAMPGPFSMGLMATREFDMYGDDPELAGLINEIERVANKRFGLGPWR